MNTIAHNFLKKFPLLFLTIGVYPVIQDDISWLWGASLWLLVAAAFFIPRMNSKKVSPTITRAITEYYNTNTHNVLSVISFLYFFSFSTYTLQHSQILSILPQNLNTYLYASLILITVILLLTIAHKTYLTPSLSAILVLISCATLPILIHQYILNIPLEKPSLFNILTHYTHYLRPLSFNTFFMAMLIGHPILSYPLLHNTEKPKTIRLYKQGALITLSLATLHTFHLPITIFPVRPFILTKNLTSLYYLSTTLLQVGVLIYMTAYTFLHNLLPIITKKQEHTLTPYLITTASIGLITLLSAIGIPGYIITYSYHALIPLIFTIQTLFIITQIGITPSTKTIYASLGTAATLYLILSFINISIISDYAIFISSSTASILLLLIHYLENQGLNIRKRTWWEKQNITEFAYSFEDVKKALLNIITLPFKLAKSAQRSVAQQRIPFQELNLKLALTAIFALYLFAIPPSSPHTNLIYTIFIFNIITWATLVLLPAWPHKLTYYFSLFWNLIVATYLITTPTLYYLLAPNKTIALINIALSMVILARYITPKAFLTLYLFSLSSIGTILYLYQPQILSDLFSQLPTNLYPLFYTHVITYITNQLFIHKTSQEIQTPRNKLNALVKKSLSLVSNTLNITQSHASMIGLCAETMAIEKQPKDPNNENEKILLAMEQGTYHTMQDNLQLLLQSMQDSRTKLKTLFIPITNKISTHNPSSYHVLPCIQEALTTLQKNYDIDIKPTLHTQDDFSFHGSDQALIAVLVQILKNAYDYSDHQKPISIHLNHRKIYITNHGSTIPPQHQPHIFNEFFSSSHENLGLGLFFAQQVMETMGGSIYINTTPYQKQTSFILAFPAS